MGKEKENEFVVPELTIEGQKDIEWTWDKIEKVPTKQWLYNVICFLLRKKKLTYQEMFLVLYGIFFKKFGEKKSKELAVERLIAIYEFNNGVLPEGIEHERT